MYPAIGPTLTRSAVGFADLPLFILTPEIAGTESTFQPLTSDEKKLYSRIFKSLDKDKSGIITGEVAGLTFEKSGLDSETLYRIWELADKGNSGFLNQFDFIRAMRMIGHVQSGKPLSGALADVPAPAPTFAGIFGDSPATTGPAIQPQFSNSSSINSQPVQTFPIINSVEIGKFVQLFNRHAPNQLTIGGLEARDVFLKAKLQETTLGLIWNLADRGGKGSLTKDEFSLAMVLIQGFLKGVLKLVPLFVPEAAWSQISKAIADSQISTSLSIQQQSTGNLLGLSDAPTRRVSTAIQPTPTSSWTINQQQKQEFDKIFESLDKSHLGVVGAAELAPFLLSSKLGQADLASIWELSDITQSGKLTKVEFAICMYLVQRKLRNETLPAVVPQELLESARARHSEAQATNVASFAPIQQQQTKSSLNDLVDIFGSAPAKQEEPKPVTVNSTGNSIGSYDSASRSVAGARKFKPSSNFGQQIIHEQDVKEEKKTSLLHDSDNSDSGDDSDISYTYKPKVTAPVVPAAPASQSAPNYNAFREIASKPKTVAPPPPTARHTNSNGYDEHTRELNNVSSQITQEHINVANLDSQIKSIDAQSAEIKSKIAGSKAELAAVREAKGTYETRLAQVKALLEDETVQYESIKTSVVESQQENESLRQQASMLEAEYNNHQSEYQSYQAQLTEKQNENSGFREKIGTLTGENNDLTKQLEEFKKALTSQISYNEVQARQVDVLKTKNISVLNDIKAAETELEAAKSKAADIENQRAIAEHEVSKSVDTHNQKKSAIESVSAPIAAVGVGAVAAAGAAVGAVVGSDNSGSSDTKTLSEPVSTVKKNNPFLNGYAASKPSGEDLKDFTEFPSHEDFQLQFNEEVKSPANTEKDTTVTKDTADSTPPASDFQFNVQNNGLQLPYGLPIPRPESLTSSVQNNAANSVRGDIDDTEAVGSSVVSPSEQVPVVPVQENKDEWYEQVDTFDSNKALQPHQDLSFGNRTNSIISSAASDDWFTDAKEDLASPIDKPGKLEEAAKSAPAFDAFDSQFSNLAPATQDAGLTINPNKSTSTILAADDDEFDAAFTDLKVATDETPKRAAGLDNPVEHEHEAFGETKHLPELPKPSSRKVDDFESQFTDLSPTEGGDFEAFDFADRGFDKSFDEQFTEQPLNGSKSTNDNDEFDKAFQI